MSSGPDIAGASEPPAHRIITSARAFGRAARRAWAPWDSLSRGLGVAVIVVTASWSPSPAHAQGGAHDEPVEGEAVRQRFLSLRGSVYSKHLRSIDSDGWGLRFRLQASVGLYKFKTLDELLLPSIDSLGSVGLRPGLEFEYPLALRDVAFVPEIEVAANHVFDGSKNDLSAALTGALRYRRGGRADGLTITAAAKYASRLYEDGLNVEDYLEWSLAANFKQSLGARLGDRDLVVKPYAKFSYFTDDLQLDTGATPVFDVSKQYELGLEFNVAPRLRLWKLSLPGLRISYVFGDDTRGVRIRF